MESARRISMSGREGDAKRLIELEQASLGHKSSGPGSLLRRKSKKRHAIPSVVEMTLARRASAVSLLREGPSTRARWLGHGRDEPRIDLRRNLGEVPTNSRDIMDAASREELLETVSL